MSTFLVGGNRRTRRNSTTFGRVLTDSSHARAIRSVFDTVGLEPITLILGDTTITITIVIQGLSKDLYNLGVQSVNLA